MDKQPSCSTCDFMRYQGQTMRCFWEAPVPHLVALVQSKLQGAPPLPVITGLSPEVTEDRFCRHHPELRMEGEVKQSPGVAVTPAPQPDVATSGGIILPASETRQ